MHDDAAIRFLYYMFAEAAKLLGKVDVLINYAVYWSGSVGLLPSVDNMTDEEFTVGLDGVLVSTFRSTREAIPYLEITGGAIVNFSSMYGVVSPDPRIYVDSGQNNPRHYYCIPGHNNQTVFCSSSSVSLRFWYDYLDAYAISGK